MATKVKCETGPPNFQIRSMFNAKGGAGDRVLGTCTYYSNQVRGVERVGGGY